MTAAELTLFVHWRAEDTNMKTYLMHIRIYNKIISIPLYSLNI